MTRLIEPTNMSSAMSPSLKLGAALLLFFLGLAATSDTPSQKSLLAPIGQAVQQVRGGFAGMEALASVGSLLGSASGGGASKSAGGSGGGGGLFSESKFTEALQSAGLIGKQPHIQRLLGSDSAASYENVATAELIKKLGFQCDQFRATSTDGYGTWLLRMTNPRAAKKQLKQPPVVLYAGQSTSPAVWLLSDALAARPLAWPRAPLDGQPLKLLDSISGRTSNRSLALTLANNGYEVWLVPARGADAANRERAAAALSGAGAPKHTKRQAEAEAEGQSGSAHATAAAAAGNSAQAESKLAPGIEQLRSLPGYDTYSKFPGYSQMEKMVEGEPVQQLLKSTDHFASFFAGNKHNNHTHAHSKSPLGPLEGIISKLPLLGADKNTKDYWAFSQDEIIEHEFKCQLELVMQTSGQRHLSLVTYSQGAFVAFAFMAKEPEFAAKHLDTYVAIGPAVFVNKFNLVLGAAGLLSHFNLPNSPFWPDQIDSVARGAVLQLCKGKLLRYHVCKHMLDSLYGHSDRFQTQLDAQLFHYIHRPQSANGLKQLLQVGWSGKLRHFDRGILGNLAAYGSHQPPAYELSAVRSHNIHLIGGERDAVADPKSLELLASSLGAKPKSCVTVPGYNHIDLLAAHDVHLKVNEPVLRILDDRYLERSFYDDKKTAGGQADQQQQSQQQQQQSDYAGDNSAAELPAGQSADSQQQTQSEDETHSGDNQNYDEENQARGLTPKGTGQLPAPPAQSAGRQIGQTPAGVAGGAAPQSKAAAATKQKQFQPRQMAKIPQSSVRSIKTPQQ